MENFHVRSYIMGLESALEEIELEIDILELQHGCKRPDIENHLRGAISLIEDLIVMNGGTIMTKDAIESIKNNTNN